MIQQANTMSARKLSLPFLLCMAISAQQNVEVVPVISKAVQRQVKLPGEFQPYMSVPIHAKVSGFVKTVTVDKGSMVRAGQVLATLEAPEMQAQVAEAESKAQAVDLQRAESQAKLASAQSTYDRLKAAAQTPGVVAGNDLVVAEKNVEAVQAQVHSFEGLYKAAESSVQALRDLERYLTIRAPFDGIIVERQVHPGALVGPNAGPDAPPLVRLQQNSRLRLVVSVPENLVGGIVNGAHVPFTVPAFPGETFSGVMSRNPHSLEEKTRSMEVELDVSNPGLRLAPGMYPEVNWPVRSPRPVLLVPPTSIVTTTERTFVIKDNDGAAQWVDVSHGAQAGDLVEVRGSLHAGDLVVKRGSDEIREGTRLTAK
jgi:membrane fusion protein, multidrug efflux system